MTAAYFEIRVAGALPAAALRGFKNLTVLETAETVLRGTLPDRAALNGLLARLETAGIQVLEVRKLKRAGMSDS